MEVFCMVLLYGWLIQDLELAYIKIHITERLWLIFNTTIEWLFKSVLIKL